MRISLKRFIHEWVLSTTHRLALHRGFFFIRCASSPRDRIWGTKWNRCSSMRTSSKSYPLSIHIPCRFFFVGFGRLMGILVIVSFAILKSFRFAPSMARPIGMPCPSVSKLRFTPCFARSVGFGPLFFPRKRCFPHRSIHGTEAPVNALQFVVFPKALLPELFEYSCLVPFLESAVS